MEPRPVLARLLAPFTGMIVLVVLICGGVVFWTGQHTIHTEQVQDLDRLSTLVHQWLDPGTQIVTEQQRLQIAHVADVLDTRITLIDGAGQVLLDTHTPHERLNNHNNRPEVIEARSGRVGSGVRFSQTTRQNSVYVARLLDLDRPDGTVVRLSYPRAGWRQFATPAAGVVAAAVALALLVMGWLARLLQRQWIGPVQALRTAAAQMAAGQWQTRVDPRGADELRSFSEKLNTLAAKAQQQLSELETQRSDLRALVDSLPDPILLSDASRRIVLINAPAARLLQVKPSEAPGMPVVEVVNDEAVLVLFESLQPHPGNMQQRELRLARNGQRLIFHAVATRTRAGGVLLVLRNVSAMAATVQMKTDFVANASHELRTPIAAIKVAFETLQDVYSEDPEQTARCIAVIDGHLKRLEEMLSDLLDLSRVESSDIRPHLSTIEARALLEVVRNTMGPVARQKNLRLVLEQDPDDSLKFESDKRLLELVLKNLVENSIKYTPAGGQITVSILEAQSADGRESRRGSIVLKVQDSGIGIPAEHLDRVFERFYQVDSSRSGSAGRGTGLGLAIVKHAINALDGDVVLQSRVGAGTTVICTFPLREPAEISGLTRIP